ncbi:MAG: cyanophycin synthetase, partial [Thermoleophilaceae bacterium]
MAIAGSPVNARQAEEYLLGLELFGMRFGLDRMHKLMTALGMPQRRFASIHVVGSNGKSSTVRYIAAILERHGLRTGSYTSPHLGSFQERIEVGEQPLGGSGFAAAVSNAAHAAELVNRTVDDDDEVTQFEALTAAAYHELARREVDVAVIEAGLGGRFDATNVIPSAVQVVTGVGLEHTRWLGPTLADIAAEKLAVVRDHAVLVAGELPAEAETVLSRVADERHARVVRAADEEDARPDAPTGAFQRRNFALARAAAQAFAGDDRPLNPDRVRSAAAETRIRGRLDVTGESPLVIHDGAHNPAGAHELARALPELLERRGGGNIRPVVGVISILDDKDPAAILAELLPVCDKVVLTACSNPRALPAPTLVTLAQKLGGPPAETAADPARAVERASELAGPGGAVLAAGSIYL